MFGGGGGGGKAVIPKKETDVAVCKGVRRGSSPGVFAGAQEKEER